MRRRPDKRNDVVTTNFTLYYNILCTLCCGRRQEATTAAAAPAARIDWPPAAAGWPAPCSRDALENQRNIKRTPRKRLRRQSRPARRAATYCRTLYIILYTRARARAPNSVCTRIRTSARDGRYTKIYLKP